MLFKSKIVVRLSRKGNVLFAPVTVIILSAFITLGNHVIAQQRTWNQSPFTQQQVAAPTIQPAIFYQNISQSFEQNLNRQNVNNNNNYATAPNTATTNNINTRPVNADGFNQGGSTSTTPLTSVTPLDPVRRPPQSIQSVQAVQRFPQVEGIQFEKRVNPQQLLEITQGNERFSKRLFKEIINAAPNHDLIFSPFSVWSLLASVAEGASRQTLTELMSVLNVNDNSVLADAFDQIFKALVVEGGKQQTIELSVFQALFYNQSQPVNREYEQLIRNKYHADTYPFDSTQPKKAIEDVNQKVREKTNNQLRAAFSQADLQSASLLLLSLIHFRGQWAQPFNQSFTKEEPFYNENGEETGKVQMMFQRSILPYAPIKELQSHVIELPYGDMNRLSMLVILPRKNVPLSDVVERIQNVKILDILSILTKALTDFEDDEIETYLPKFEITSDLGLNEILQDLGLREIFTTEASLDNINPNIYLSKLVHKAKIQVDEQGTIASAITGGVFANKSSAPRFYANRPFLFLIVDKTTGLVLFCGQMKNNPSHNRQRSNRY